MSPRTAVNRKRPVEEAALDVEETPRPEVCECGGVQPEAAAELEEMHLILCYGNRRSIRTGDDKELWEKLCHAEAQAPDQTLKNHRAVVVLESVGGDANVAYKMANMLHWFFAEVEVVVPYRAKSAATLLSMCADRLIMGPLSELGPLDVQTEHPGTEASWVSGLDIVGALDKTIVTAVQWGEQAALNMRFGPGISRKNALEIGMSFGASVVQGLLSQIEPIAVFAADRALQTASEYGRRLLRRYMLADNPEMIDLLMGSLIERYPTHGFVIDAQEAKDLGMSVVYASDYEGYDVCHRIYATLSLAANDMVMEVCPPGAFDGNTPERQEQISEIAEGAEEDCNTGQEQD